MDPLLDKLNPQQREAVTCTDGPLLILAGAGSGKTRVLTYRVAHLLRQGVPPWAILAITFTNKAAREMKDRVEVLVGLASRSIWVSTFHAACVRILRRDIDKLGQDPRFVILDTGDQESLVKECLKECNLDDKRFHPAAVLGTISGAKNELVGPEAFAQRASDYYSERVAAVYRLYQQKLARHAALDFDDLIARTVELLQGRPDVRDYYQDRFRYIHVDEYQDTNHAQYVLVRSLAGKWHNLCVVGDPDQSIYAWRGADIRNILNFERDYPQARVVKLEQNYRSTQNILSAADAVIKHNLARVEKRLWTSSGAGEQVTAYEAASEHDEAWFITGEVERRRESEGKNRRDFAVLYRTHAQSRVLEEVFLRRQIPYVIVGGLKFYERKEVKDVLAYLRLLVNPNDLVSFRRVLNVPRRGLGPASLQKIEALALELGIPILEAAGRTGEAGLGKAAAAKVRDFAGLVAALASGAAFMPVYDVIEEVLQRTGYLAELAAQGSPESQSRVENLRELQSVAREFDRSAADLTPESPEEVYAGERGLAGFLTGVALVAEADTFDPDADAVVFMTLHSAKGLEFPVVFLAGMEEGVFPHLRSLADEGALEEERRLCYVGMTRAKEGLYLTRAVQRTLYGQTFYNAPSRFLLEVPPQVLRDAAGEGGGPDAPSAAPTPTVAPFLLLTGRRRAAASGGPRVTAARAATDLPAESDFAPGEKVRHPTWGVGTVVTTRGSGADAEVTIAFPAQGVKKVITRYALLRRAPD